MTVAPSLPPTDLRDSSSPRFLRLPHQRNRSSDAETRVQREAETDDLLHRAVEATTTEREQLLDQVVVLNIPVANAIVGRYRARGVPEDDLFQVAYLALVKAARRFDLGRGDSFVSYAVPTVRGEIKRWFRDHGWTVRPTRRMQELQARLFAAESELSSRLGRSPRPSELAAHLEEPLAEVNEALAIDGCFVPASLDRPVGEPDSATLGDLIGEDDEAIAAAEARTMLAPVVRRLGERDRRILSLRFFSGWTQAEIGADLGVTQMQVSRLLTRILGDLRESLDDEAEPTSRLATAGRRRPAGSARR